MIDLKEKVKKNPIMFFLIILIGIAVFLSISFIIAFLISINPTISVVSSFFNKTNVSTTLDFFVSTTANGYKCQVNSSCFSNTFSFDSISSIIALLGSFGVFAYLFYSIREGTLSKTDNKKLLYGFQGGMGIIIFLVAIIFISSSQGKFPIEKNLEIIGLIFFLFLTGTIANFFLIVFDEIEENYDNRAAIIDFLEIHNSNAVIWQPIDNFARYIVYISDFFSTSIFILICFIPVSGILIGLNLLSIIFIEIMIFALFSGFCRLIKLCESDSNISLNHQFYSKQYSFSSKYLSKVFFLPSQDDSYFKILTKKGYITILKNEIITIHDNEVIIFKGKENLSPLNIWIKRGVRFVLSSIFAYLIYQLVFTVTIIIAIFVQPIDLLQILHTTMSLLQLTIQGIIAILAFCFIGWFSEEFDERLEAFVDRFIIVPRQLDFY